MNYFICICAILLFLFIINLLPTTTKEPFFTDASKKQFIAIQHTINPYQIYDTAILETQVDQSQMDEFAKTQRWPWSPETIQLYKQAFSRNPYVRDAEDHGVDYARSIYNETAILRILSNQAKEGQFLINGYQDSATQTVVRCKYDGTGLETVEQTGYDPIAAIPIKQHRDISLADAARLIPGLRPLADNAATCNPCTPLQQVPDYSCPFLLPEQSDPSPVWATLWGLAR